MKTSSGQYKKSKFELEESIIHYEDKKINIVENNFQYDDDKILSKIYFS